MQVSAAGKKKGYAKLDDDGTSTSESGDLDVGQMSPQASAAPPAAPVDTVPITILTQTGKKIPLQVDLSWSVVRLKEVVQEESGVERILQRLIFHGRIMDETKLISDYKVQPGNTVHLFARLREHLVPQAIVAPAGVPGVAGLGQPPGMTPVVLSGGGLAQQLHVANNVQFQNIGLPGPNIFANMQLAHYSRRVKLWSSLLLIWSTMHLFNTLVLLADPHAADRRPSDDDYSDDGKHGNSGQADMKQPHITMLETTVDLFLNIVGVYVGLSGFRASTRLNAQLSFRYHAGLVGLLVMWAVAGVIRLVEAQKQGILDSPSKLMMGVVILVGLPTMMWSFCVVQASQFRRLIASTEQANLQQQQSEAAMRQA